MKRRNMLLSAGAVALAGVVANSTHGQGVQGKNPSVHDKMENECIEICQKCETICNETAKYCFQMLSQGKKEFAECAELLVSCQDFCGLSAKILARSCTLSTASSAACATACQACAKECEKMKSDLQMMACAKACQECHDSCSKMA